MSTQHDLIDNEYKTATMALNRTKNDYNRGYHNCLYDTVYNAYSVDIKALERVSKMPIGSNYRNGYFDALNWLYNVAQLAD